MRSTRTPPTGTSADALSEPSAGTGEEPEATTDEIVDSVRQVRRFVPQEDDEIMANGILLELRRAVNSLTQIREG